MLGIKQKFNYSQVCGTVVDRLDHLECNETAYGVKLGLFLILHHFLLRDF